METDMSVSNISRGKHAFDTSRIIRGPVSVMTSAQAACVLPFLQGADSPMQVPCRHS